MRNGLLGLVAAALLAATMATAGCKDGSSGGGAGGTGGSSGGSTGGSTSSGGAVGTGGSTSSGGTVASGGRASSGGAVGTGGSTGSGGGAGGGGSITTLSGSKTLGTLSTDEGAQLCDDAYAYFVRSIPQATACKWKGLSYATSSSAPTEEKLRSNCTTKEGSCLAADPSAVWPNPGCGDLPSSCTATVAEYSTCVSDEVVDFNQTVGGLPLCADFTKDGAGAMWDIMGRSAPSCTSLMEKCPELSVPTLYM